MSNLAGLPSITSMLEAQGVLAKKSFGQHFLIDPEITDRIARTAGDLREVEVVEIGPGPGGLTRSLLACGARRVVAVEKDRRFLPMLQAIRDVAEGRLTVIEGDGLEISPLDITASPRAVVANLPYNAGTDMLLRWLDMIHASGPQAFRSLTLMFQREVAERIVAAPGSKDYGRLSVVAQWLCEARLDFELPPEVFMPPPKVHSAVVTLVPRARPLIEVDKKALEALTAAAFGQRRKMLRGALKSLGVDTGLLLERAGIAGTARIEELSVAGIAMLARCYQEMITPRASV